MLGAGSILAGAFIGAGIGALSTTAMKAGEEISTGNVRSAGERLAYAVFDDSMSWDEKWAYAFDPEQMVSDFVTGVVIARSRPRCGEEYSAAHRRPGFSGNPPGSPWR